MRNRWGVEIKKGHWVFATGPRGGRHEGRVVAVDARSACAKAYGPQVTLDSGVTVGADDISQTLGPMEIGPDGVVMQNPLTRIKHSQIATKPSQSTGLAPDKRLIKRRRKTAAMPVPGIYANPLTRVRVTSESQRPHRSAATGKMTKSPSGRLRARRKQTVAMPEGFYANPTRQGVPDVKWAVWKTTPQGAKLRHLAFFSTKPEAVTYAKAWAEANKHTAGVERFR